MCSVIKFVKIAVGFVHLKWQIPMFPYLLRFKYLNCYVLLEERSLKFSEAGPDYAMLERLRYFKGFAF